MSAITVVSPSDAQSHLGGVEVMRGIAAVLVVLVHASNILSVHFPLPFSGFWKFGRAGVDFFFVLSGFIIAYIHLKDIGRPHTVSSFWFKRLLRIYPAYWIVTALYGVLLFVSPTSSRAEQDIGNVIFSLLLLPDVTGPILNVGWTLRHELLFYGLFSLLLLHRSIGFAVMLLWAAGIVWNLAFHLQSGTPYFDGIAGSIVFRGFNIQFFFGIAVAWIMRANLQFPPRSMAVLGGLGFLATGMYETFATPIMHEWPIRSLSYGISAAMLLLGVATMNRSGRLAAPMFALRVGSASYSIYLLHVPVCLVAAYGARFANKLVPLPSEIWLVTLVATSVYVGLVFSEMVELPILRLGRQVLGSRRLPAGRFQPGKT